MPKVLKSHNLIQFWSWENSLFQLLALWGNKNWPPSMKVKKMELFLNKCGSKGCIWSSLNSPGNGNSLFHDISSNFEVGRSASGQWPGITSSSAGCAANDGQIILLLTPIGSLASNELDLPRSRLILQNRRTENGKSFKSHVTNSNSEGN